MGVHCLSGHSNSEGDVLGERLVEAAGVLVLAENSLWCCLRKAVTEDEKLR